MLVEGWEIHAGAFDAFGGMDVRRYLCFCFSGCHSERSEPAVSRFSPVSPQTLCSGINHALPALAYGFLGGTSKERETAGSLAALGMTNQKSKDNLPLRDFEDGSNLSPS
jgi:hypothetical protein